MNASKTNALHRCLNFLIALVWLVNGLFCKVLGYTPRHRQIVATIAGGQHADLLTTLIGIAEIGMTIWILSRILPRLNAVVQIIIIATMNTIEFFLVPGLLLWGKLNAVFALAFILVIYCNEFILKKQPVHTA